jgi:hypothetical protein
MKSLSREDRLIENEVIFRDVNKNMKDFIKEEPGAKASESIPFYCECALPNCIERINLSAKEYEELHQNAKQFVILAGHEFPEVEKVIKKSSKYRVVEKHFTPPKAKDIDLALKSISSSMPSA